MPEHEANLQSEKIICSEREKIEKYISNIKYITSHNEAYQDFIDNYAEFINRFQLKFDEIDRLRCRCIRTKAPWYLKLFITFTLAFCTINNTRHEYETNVICVMIFLLNIFASEIASYYILQKYRAVDSMNKQLVTMNCALKDFHLRLDDIIEKFRLENKLKDICFKNVFQALCKPTSCDKVWSFCSILCNPFMVICALQLSYMSYPPYRELSLFANQFSFSLYVISTLGISVYILHAILHFKKISFLLNLRTEDFILWFEDLCSLRKILEEPCCSGILDFFKNTGQDLSAIVDREHLSNAIFLVYVSEIMKCMKSNKNMNVLLHFLLCKRSHEIVISSENMYDKQLGFNSQQESAVEENSFRKSEESLGCITKNQNEQYIFYRIIETTDKIFCSERNLTISGIYELNIHQNENVPIHGFSESGGCKPLMKEKKLQTNFKRKEEIFHCKDSRLISCTVALQENKDLISNDSCRLNCDEVMDNEKPCQYETPSVSLANIAPQKDYSTKNVSSESVDLLRIFKETGEPRSIKNPFMEFMAHSVTQDKENKLEVNRHRKKNKHLVHPYRQPIFSYSSANDKQNTFWDDSSSNNGRSLTKDISYKVHYKKRRQISSSESRDDEMNEESDEHLKRRDLQSETLQRIGYFLSVRKTKHFCLFTKMVHPLERNKDKPYVNPSSSNHDDVYNKSYSRRYVDKQCFAEKANVRKPKQSKMKAKLKLKLLSSESEEDEFGHGNKCMGNRNVEENRRKQKNVRTKLKRGRLSIETDMRSCREIENLTFTVKKLPEKISKSNNSNLRLENSNSDSDEIYWILNSNPSMSEHDLSSSLPAGSSDDENFHFHASTDVSSNEECASESNSKFRDFAGHVPNSRTKASSCDASEAYEKRSESDTSYTDFAGRMERNTHVWSSSFENGCQIVREFTGNAENTVNSIDDYVIRPQNTAQNGVYPKNSKPKNYHLKYGNINLRFFDDPHNYVTLRLNCENEQHSSEDASYSEAAGNSNYLAMKECKSESVEMENSCSSLSSNDSTSRHVVTTDEKHLVDKKGDGGEEDSFARTKNRSAIDAETLKFDFKPERGVTEVKFRRTPSTTCLQYKSEKSKLYFKKKYLW